jgi:Rrf2 family nitric oxide-sensitive transcriptional repressor
MPQSLLAKVMQTLKRNEIVTSVKGTSGGYTLATALDQITFLQFLRIFEDDTSLVECLGFQGTVCQQEATCTIRDPIAAVNAVIQHQLRSLTLMELFDMQPEHSIRVSVQRLTVHS